HLDQAKGFISEEFDAECARKYKPQKNDIFMVKSGSTTGKVAFVDTDANFNIWSPIAAMRTDNAITARYVYHLLQTDSIQNMVQTRMSHGSQPNLSMRVIEQFDVKIPSLDDQKRIVAILDKFDALTNDLSQGLPAELAMHRAQYEYYRDKLLTFSEKESA
ncbi:MAG: restriction endonuclease subunit S, partial [Thermoguttaceae bacterium]|nr:restriction endonuclease subunit S [Thermoguttaceae bacterium]